MVSTWRFWSGKEINPHPQPSISVVVVIAIVLYV